jgi:hypothetical protein
MSGYGSLGIINRKAVVPQSWHAAIEALRGANERKLSKVVTLRKDGETVIVRLYDTAIVTIHENFAVLNAGEYKTETTKAYLNDFLGSRGHIWSQDGIWVYGYKGTQFRAAYDQTTVFYNALCVRTDGSLVTEAIDFAAERKRRTALRRKVTKYINGFEAVLKAGEVGNPGPADCFYCQGLVQNSALNDGKLVVTNNANNATDNTDHLWSHIEESYYVPSLLFNAIKERNYVDPVLIYEMSKRSPAFMRRDLQRYLAKRLL